MSPSSITVDCYTRAGWFGPPVDESIETLRDYDRRGVLDDLTVEMWPDEVVLREDPAEPPLIDQYRRFQTWADQMGVSLRPGFSIHERGSLVSEETSTALVLPVVCLAIHVDGELTSVAPHRTDAGTYTVPDALDDLASPERYVQRPLQIH